MPDGKARQFTFAMEAKSIITRPAGGQVLDGRGFYDITALAWSGRGTITRVEISTDDGNSWQEAQLNAPVLPRAVTRFSLPCRRDGRAMTLPSLCNPDLAATPPTRHELRPN